jgi:hypothetical protein
MLPGKNDFIGPEFVLIPVYDGGYVMTPSPPMQWMIDFSARDEPCRCKKSETLNYPIFENNGNQLMHVSHSKDPCTFPCEVRVGSVLLYVNDPNIGATEMEILDSLTDKWWQPIQERRH